MGSLRLGTIWGQFQVNSRAMLQLFSGMFHHSFQTTSFSFSLEFFSPFPFSFIYLWNYSIIFNNDYYIRIIFLLLINLFITPRRKLKFVVMTTLYCLVELRSSFRAVSGQFQGSFRALDKARRIGNQSRSSLAGNTSTSSTTATKMIIN